MTFGERLLSQEFTDNFFEECEDMGATLSDMRTHLEEVKEHQGEIKGANHRSFITIRERIKQYDFCPRCDGELLFDEKRNESYCPVCE